MTRVQELELNAGGEIYSGAGSWERIRPAMAAYELGHALLAQGLTDDAAILFRTARKRAERAADRFYRGAALRRSVRA